MLEVGNRHRIGRTTFEPFGRVDFVSNFPTLHQRVDSVLPEAVIHESDRERAAGPQRFENDRRWIREFVHGARADDTIKMLLWKCAHERCHVALVSGKSAADTCTDFAEIEINTDGRDVLCLYKVIEQRTAAAAEIEHSRIRLHPITDDLHINGSLFNLAGHGNFVEIIERKPLMNADDR